MVNVADRIASLLAPHVGTHTARNALRTFAQLKLGKRPEQLTPADAPRLVEELRPMLQTLLGREAALRLVEDLLALVRP